MSRSLDRAVAVLDVGLQQSTEHGYGTDHAPERCARCLRGSVTEGDLCAACRSFLLGDTNDDPTSGSSNTDLLVSFSVSVRPLVEACNRMAEDFLRAWDHMVDTLATAGTSIEDLRRMAEQRAAVPTMMPDTDSFRHRYAAVCPTHGTTKGGTCMKCARGRS